MILIRPEIEYEARCPLCRQLLKHKEIVWQGLHICAVSLCAGCGGEFLCDLPHGQGNVTPLLRDKKSGIIYDLWNSGVGSWYRDPLEEIADSPRPEPIEFKIERFRSCSRVILLNTIDFLYGHSLSGLFNAERHLNENPDLGLIVITQPFLRWLVPDGVAEVWTISLPMKSARHYYTSIDDRINKECNRFEQVHLSSGDVQPTEFDISRFTRIPIHDFAVKDFRITFIWREDAWRMWHPRNLIVRILSRARVLSFLRWWQAQKVKSLFRRLRSQVPEGIYTVAGLGRSGAFPKWVEDVRVSKFDAETERSLCKVYSQSRLVIGPHGSNMILPSAQAGMAISLMPQKRWSCFAQDLIFNERDDRMAVFQKRILPITVPLGDLADICENMIHFRSGFILRMVTPFKDSSPVSRSEP